MPLGLRMSSQQRLKSVILGFSAVIRAIIYLGCEMPLNGADCRYCAYLFVCDARYKPLNSGIIVRELSCSLLTIPLLYATI